MGKGIRGYLAETVLSSNKGMAWPFDCPMLETMQTTFGSRE